MRFPSDLLQRIRLARFNVVSARLNVRKALKMLLASGLSVDRSIRSTNFAETKERMDGLTTVGLNSVIGFLLLFLSWAPTVARP